MNSTPTPDQPALEPPGAVPEDPGSVAEDDWLELLNDPQDSGGIRSRSLGRLLETGPQPFAIVDLRERIIQTNRAFSDLVGYSRDELLGMSIMDLTAPQSRAVTRRYQAEVLATGRNERAIKNYRRKDGSLVPVELMIDVFRDDLGQPRGLYAFITDISERVRAEEALKNSEQRYRDLYDEAPVGYHEIDADIRIININRTACELLGYPSDELVGKSVLQICAGRTCGSGRESQAEAGRYPSPGSVPAGLVGDEGVNWSPRSRNASIVGRMAGSRGCGASFRIYPAQADRDRSGRVGDCAGR